MKIYPSDIDGALETLEAVTDVCAFGYEGDPLYGENVGVAIVLADASEHRLREVRSVAAQRLAPHQLPVRWYVVSEIPRTSRGKVNRRRVAEACAALAPVDWRSGGAT